MEISVSNHQFNNLGYIMVDLPKDLYKALLDEAGEIQSDFSKAIPRNKNLAGHIEREFDLVKSNDALEKFVLDMVMSYDKEYRNLELIDILTTSIPMVMKNPWINFQAKHEFNPIHNHKGIMSFVAWLKIPYDLETEFKEGPGRFRGPDKPPLNSTFTFLYVASSGQIATHTINVDKSFEGKLILFPSKMMHSVYPFYTSDDYRISISGNVMLDPAPYNN
jgi:hypothetical protein